MKLLTTVDHQLAVQWKELLDMHFEHKNAVPLQHPMGFEQFVRIRSTTANSGKLEHFNIFLANCKVGKLNVVLTYDASDNC